MGLQEAGRRQEVIMAQNSRILAVGGFEEQLDRLRNMFRDMTPEEREAHNRRCDEFDRQVSESRKRNLLESIIPNDCYGVRNGLTYPPERKQFYERVMSAWDTMKANRNGVLLLSGESGAGKSYVASWLVWDVISRMKLDAPCWDCSYYFSGDLARRYKGLDSFSPPETHRAIIGEFKSRDFIVVDEIGLREDKYEQLALYDIAENTSCPLVLITNLPPCDFRNYIGAPTYDRLKGKGVVTPNMAGLGSWRREGKSDVAV